MSATCPSQICCEISPFSYQVACIPPSLEIGVGNPELVCSTCQGEAYSNTITATGIGPELTWALVSGTLPPGLTFHGGFNVNGTVLIDGTPTTPGHYSIVVSATDGNGNVVQDTFEINVVGITVTSLPDWTIGMPYSFQMTATGGSGNYAWKITDGALPDGMFMDITGLIQGTPTGATAGSPTIDFFVIDVGCEESDPSFFTPHVTMVGESQTTISTVLGYSEFIPSSPPKKYHKLSWTGTSSQTAETVDAHLDCCGARYDWSGTGEIDTNGVQISNYVKNFYAECPFPAWWPKIQTGTNINILKGYCWPTDPASCGTCQNPFAFGGNVATNSLSDGTDFLNDPSNGIHTVTSVMLQNISAANVVMALVDNATTPGAGVTNFPLATLNGLTEHWIIVHANHNYTATLTDEYTDAEALTHALVVNGNGLTAETLPRTTGFTNRWTTVSFTLNFSGLIPGAHYAATVTFIDSDGTETIHPYTFTAIDVTHTISDSVPTPATQHRITVARPTVGFAP